MRFGRPTSLAYQGKQRDYTTSIYKIPNSSQKGIIIHSTIMLIKKRESPHPADPTNFEIEKKKKKINK